MSLFNIVEFKLSDNMQHQISAEDVVRSHIYPKDGEIFLVLVVKQHV